MPLKSMLCKYVIAQLIPRFIYHWFIASAFSTSHKVVDFMISNSIETSFKTFYHLLTVSVYLAAFTRYSNTKVSQYIIYNNPTLL